MYLRRLLSIAVSALLAAPSFAPASPSSSLNGLITSAQGKPLARLSLDLLNLDTGRVTTAQTDGAGAFRVSLDPGLYTVDAGRSGYRVARGPQVVKLVAGQAITANLALANTAALAMMQTGDQKVAVSGEVQSAGSFTFTAGMTVRQAVAQAGGMTSDAATDSVTIVRNGVELAGQLDDPLQAGDKVIVRKKGSKAAAVVAGTAVAAGTAAGLSTAAIVAIAAAAIGVTATAIVVAKNDESPSPNAPTTTQPPATTQPPSTTQPPPATTQPPPPPPPRTNPPATTLPPSGSVSR